MNTEQVLNVILKSLRDLIFEVEQIKDKLKKETYIIEIKDSKGNIVKIIQTELDIN